MVEYDVLIVGSGMAGLSAAIYAARYELTTLVIGKEMGGTTSKAWTIENYPGFESIDGYDLMLKVHQQTEALGAKIMIDQAKRLSKDGDNFIVELNEHGQFKAKAIILAVGAARRKLNLPKEDELSQGKGVHYCTTCDGPLYKNKTIVIVGGGDAAIKGANLAVQFAQKIYIVTNNSKLTPEPINLQRLQTHITSGKVEPIFETEVAELLADKRLTGVKLKNGQELKADGLFVEIGAVPEVALAEKIGVKLDERGYIAVNNMMETNIPGVFAAGDTTNFFGHFKQDITAAAMGAVAATSAFQHLGKSS